MSSKPDLEPARSDHSNPPLSVSSQQIPPSQPESHPVPTHHGTSRGLAPSPTASSSELADYQIKLKGALRQFPDFPSPGILFEDILPIFANPSLHELLVHALEIHILQTYGERQKPDVIVGLEARGFLFGPSLALRLGAAFVPVRKKGKLPGPTVTASYQKEYGEDFFQIQEGSIKHDQRVLIVDDIIATGGSAAAAGSLVKQSGAVILGYVFLMELDFLKGREKLDAPVFTLLSGQSESSKA